MVIDNARAPAATPASSPAKRKTMCQSSAPTRSQSGRDMHWLRIDNYLTSTASPAFRRCRACNASMRRASRSARSRPRSTTAEGLNLQVYNRCVGTRFCQSNCPVQSAPFQFLRLCRRRGIQKPRRREREGVFNPDVTVRAPRRDGEMHLLRPAHQRRAAQRRERKPPNPRRRSRYRLPGGLPNARHHLRRPQ